MVGIFYDNVETVTENPADGNAVLENIAAAGAEYAEITLCKWLKQPKAFHDKAKELGLSFRFCQFTDRDGKMENGDDLERYFPKLREYGARSLLVVYAYGTEPQEREAAREYGVPVMERLCRRAKENDITLTFEDFDNEKIPCGGCEDMLWFAERLPDLRFTFDTGNFAFREEDCIACYERLKGRIAHVHMKDRVAPHNLASAVTGEGYLPLKEIVTRLHGDGYRGDFTCEMYGLEEFVGMCRAVENVKAMVNSPLDS